MSKFKIGAEVRCIKADMTPLKVGQNYRITKVTTDYVYIDGDHKDGAGYYPSRFELANKNAEPTFKIGSRVSGVVNKLKPNVRVSGELVSINTGYGFHYATIRDDNRRNHMVWVDSLLAETVSKSEKIWIVVMIKDGQPLPAMRPKVMDTKAQAEAAAKVMAEKHKGETFLVFEAVSSTSVETVVQTNTVVL